MGREVRPCSLLPFWLAVVLGASAAQAVVLSPGDIIAAMPGKVIRIDPATGDRTTVSCTNTVVCPSGLVGSGASHIAGNGFALESDGSLVVVGKVAVTGERVVLRIDPATGDRVVISGAGVGSGDDFLIDDYGLDVIPPATASAVSVLPSWGLALLVGISIGAWLQLRRIKGPQRSLRQA